MILFDLICDQGHRFEGWFRSRDDFDDQLKGLAVDCPYCGTSAVEKAVTAPNLGRKSNQASEIAENREQQAPAAMTDAIPEDLIKKYKEAASEIRAVVEKHCDYVGSDFPEEARKIHYGETEARGIYGEASKAESRELIDEGIDVLPLPGLGKRGRSDA